MNNISHRIDKYLNNQNKCLWDELNSEYEIELYQDSSEFSWLVDIDFNKVKIITPNLDINLSSFTHELLHVKLDKLGMTNIENLTEFINGSQIFNNFVFRNLIFNSHNFHSHKKMYPYYNKMGFKDEEFVAVREKFTLKDNLQLRIFPKIKLFRTIGIETFLGKFFALKNDFVQNEKNITEKHLEKLKSIDKELYQIANEFDSEWNNRTDYNYIESLKLFETNLKPYLAKKYGR